MKAITSRPSAFRAVELADFMLYLDTILVGFECYVLHFGGAGAPPKLQNHV